MFAIIFLYAICAASFTLSKQIALFNAPFIISALRMALGSFAVLLLTSHTTVLRELFARRNFTTGLLVSLVVFCIPYACDLWSLSYMSSIYSACLFNGMPFITGLIEALIYKRTFPWYRWAGISIASLSFFLVLSTISFTLLLPTFVLLMGIVSSAYGWIIIGNAIPCGCDFRIINFWGMLLSALPLSLLSYFNQESLVFAASQSFWLLLFGLILSINVIFMNGYSWLLKYNSPTLLALLGGVCPLFVSIYGILFIGESVDTHSLILGGSTFLGLLFYYGDRWIPQLFSSYKNYLAKLQ